MAHSHNLRRIFQMASAPNRSCGWTTPQNCLVGSGEETNGSTYKTSYTYDNDNRVTEIGFGGDDKVKYVYDNLGRVITRIVENGTDAGKFTSNYTYVAGGHGTGSTTPLIKKIDQPHIPFEYEYDIRGNIISEKRGELTTTYTYDALGQLIRVNDPHENATWVYTYDCGGNILSKAKYAYTTGELGDALQTIPYAYGDPSWKDKLTAYNGQAITYDAIGNPLNDGTWTYTWQAGRQLKQMSKSDMTVEFKYDHNGLRTQKKVTENGTTTTTDYIYHGKLLMHMTVGDDNLHFFYDAQSRPTKVNFNSTIYTYAYNLQGDIIGILDSAGVPVVEYKYNVWGNPIVITGELAMALGKKNPFRYRGYIYDGDEELYYLGERYYDCETNRFLNVDVVKKPLSGVYTYCHNSPVNHYDPDGAEEKNCCFDQAYSIDVYIVDGANSDLLSQILVSAYGREKLDSLSVEIMDAITSNASDTTRDIVVSRLIADEASATLASYFTSTVEDIYTLLATRNERVCGEITDDYVYARSNHWTTYDHTEFVFYYGYYDSRFYMTHYDKKGNTIGTPYEKILKGWSPALEAVRAIHDAVSKLFTPVVHGHPAGLTTYNDYKWRVKLKKCAKKVLH